MSQKPYDIAVVGEINPDLILSGDIVPRFGQVEQNVDDLTLTIGSSAVIFACGAARLGLRVLFIGKVGGDAFGQFMLNAMQERGIATDAVIVDPKVRTGISVILNRGTDRAVLTYLGAIPLLELDEIPFERMTSARHLHLTSYFIQDCLRPRVPELFARAHAAGMTVSLDTNYDPSGTWDAGLAEALLLTDVFLPNETEACAIARQSGIDDAVRSLSAQIPTVAVKLGAKGAVGTAAGQSFLQPAIPVQVIDTVGAGDSFDAGFICGYLNGWSQDRCLQLGSVCGSLSTTAAGGTAAQPTLAEAQQHLNFPL